MKFSLWFLGALLLAFGFHHASAAQAQAFALKSSDRVLFYGDSITEQRYYPVAVQTFVRTRFPNLKVRFVDSGVGGDRVTGGWGGPIKLRLQRDVFPFKPNVVTIMLGMNDASYRPFNQQIFAVYKKGYRYIIHSLQAHLPGVQIVLIAPSPWDNYSQARGYPHNPHHLPGSYNDVLIRYSKFVQALAAKHHLLCVNFNTALVKVIKAAVKINPHLATGIIPGRCHPGATGQMVMAQTLLQGWNAPALVSSVSINGAKGSVTTAKNTTVTAPSVSAGSIAWSQLDKALPYPMMTLHAHWPQFAPETLYWTGPPSNPKFINPLAAMVLHLTHAYRTLDSQMLRVTGLTGNYQLKINKQVVGTFSAAQLATGVNLAKYNTPMMAQAYQVQKLVWQQTQQRFVIWRHYQLPLARNFDPAIRKTGAKLVAQMYAQWKTTDAGQYAAAQPHRDNYVLTAVLTAHD